jgi:hypothetical protein
MSGVVWPKHTGEVPTGIPVDAVSVTEWLIERGTSLGFHIERNHVSQEDGAIADVAYFLNPGQKPILTFTVEEAESMRLISGALQWAGSSTEPKSWMHICVFLGDLAGIPSIPNTAKHYEAQSLDRLPGDLDEIVAHMIKLLTHYIAQEVIDTGAAIRRIAASTVDWPRGRRNTRLGYVASTRLTGYGLDLFSAEDNEDGEAGTILKPSRKVVPLDLVSGGASFEGALMRLVEARERQLLLSSEHRNYPFIFCLSTGEHGGESSLELWFDVDKSNVPQALNFWALVEAVEGSKLVSLVGPSERVAELLLA